MTDISKLPKWAQQEIAVLRMRLEEAERKNEIFSGERTSRLSIRWGLDNEKFVPEGYRFQVNLGGQMIVIILNIDGKVLSIRNSDGRLLIIPQGSNAIDILPEGKIP